MSFSDVLSSFGSKLGSVASKVGSSALSIGKNIGSFIANDPSTFINGVSSVMGLFGNSAKQSYKYSKKLQEHQYALERQSRQTAYQDTRQSLEAAGYNPLLAVSDQSGSLPVGNQMSVTDPATERLTNGIALASAIADLKLKKAQADNVKKDTELKPYDKPLKVIGDLLQGRNSNVANSAKSVLGTIVGSGINSASSAYQQYKYTYPTRARVINKLKHFDFQGAGRVIGEHYANKYKNKRGSSANSTRHYNSKPPDIPSSWWYDGEPVRGKW